MKIKKQNVLVLLKNLVVGIYIIATILLFIVNYGSGSYSLINNLDDIFGMLLIIIIILTIARIAIVIQLEREKLLSAKQALKRIVVSVLAGLLFYPYQYLVLTVYILMFGLK